MEGRELLVTLRFNQLYPGIQWRLACPQDRPLTDKKRPLKKPTRMRAGESDEDEQDEELEPSRAPAHREGKMKPHSYINCFS